MNTHLFLQIIAWSVLIVSGFVNSIFALKIWFAFDRNLKVTIGTGCFGWLLAFVVALAYIIAS